MTHLTAISKHGNAVMHTTCVLRGPRLHPDKQTPTHPHMQDMRYFFLMLVFLLVCFGLTFSVLMSPTTNSKLNLVSLVGTSPGTEGTVASSELQVFGSLEVG